MKYPGKIKKKNAEILLEAMFSHYQLDIHTHFHDTTPSLPSTPPAASSTPLMSSPQSASSATSVNTEALNTESDQHSISEPAKKIMKTDHQDQGSCSEESFEDSEDEEFRKRMEAEEKQADSDFDIDFNLSDEEDFCDKTEPENSHNVGVEDVTKEGEIIFKV